MAHAESMAGLFLLTYSSVQMLGQSPSPVEGGAYKGAGPHSAVSPADCSLTADPSRPLSAGGKGNGAGIDVDQKSSSFTFFGLYIY